jgi:hypothetical protein
VAETHSPGESELKEAGRLRVMTVDGVIVTATWPVEGFCTSSVSVPTRAATVPEAVLKLAGVVGALAALAAPAARKLAGTTQRSPTMDTAPSTRTTRRRERARRRPDIRFAEPCGLGLIITTP